MTDNVDSEDAQLHADPRFICFFLSLLLILLGLRAIHDFFNFSGYAEPQQGCSLAGNP